MSLISVATPGRRRPGRVDRCPALTPPRCHVRVTRFNDHAGHAFSASKGFRKCQTETTKTTISGLARFPRVRPGIACAWVTRLAPLPLDKGCTAPLSGWQTAQRRAHARALGLALRAAPCAMAGLPANVAQLDGAESTRWQPRRLRRLAWGGRRDVKQWHALLLRRKRRLVLSRGWSAHGHEDGAHPSRSDGHRQAHGPTLPRPKSFLHFRDQSNS